MVLGSNLGGTARGKVRTQWFIPSFSLRTRLDGSLYTQNGCTSCLNQLSPNQTSGTSSKLSQSLRTKKASLRLVFGCAGGFIARSCELRAPGNPECSSARSSDGELAPNADVQALQTAKLPPLYPLVDIWRVSMSAQDPRRVTVSVGKILLFQQEQEVSNYT